MDRSSILRLMSVITVGMVFGFFRMLLGWLDRHTGAPVMRERINSASDSFFVEEEKYWGKSEIDSIVRFNFDDV